MGDTGLELATGDPLRRTGPVSLPLSPLGFSRIRSGCYHACYHGRSKPSEAEPKIARVDVYEYECSLERTARDFSVASEHLAVEVEADGQRAKVKARLALNDEAFVEVREVVETDQGVVRPRAYSYYFVERGVERWGYDLDPRHDPSAHMHRGAAHERRPASVVTLGQVVEEAWDATSQAAESEAVASPGAQAAALSASSFLP
jgi:hypothetical protein